VANDPSDPLAAPRPAEPTPAIEGAGVPDSALGELPPVLGAPDHTRKPTRQRDRSRGLRSALEWAMVFVVAIGVAYGMRQYVVGTYYIPSASMEPTLMVGDRILVNKVSYHLHDVHRGDIVVFGRPPGEAATQIKDLVKRVIGLPGETISSGPDGQVLVDGQPISQPWLTAGARTNPGPAIVRQTIPHGEYFVMGDNRGNSEDSRFFGPIPRSIVVGHVVLRFWPLGQFHYFGTLSVTSVLLIVLVVAVLIALVAWAVGRRSE
jgi:signal peptidase I